MQSKISLTSSKSSNSSEYIRVWEDNVSITSVKSIYKVPKPEQHIYYFSIYGDRQPGLKLVFRTSKNIFTPPTGPENDLYVKQLLSVNKHNKLGQDNL
jgi:hypothetical protein